MHSVSIYRNFDVSPNRFKSPIKLTENCHCLNENENENEISPSPTFFCREYAKSRTTG